MNLIEYISKSTIKARYIPIGSILIIKESEFAMIDLRAADKVTVEDIRPCKTGHNCTKCPCGKVMFVLHSHRDKELLVYSCLTSLVTLDGRLLIE